MSEMTRHQTLGTGPEYHSIGSCTSFAPDSNPSDLEMDSDGWLDATQPVGDSLLWPFTSDFPAVDASNDDLAHVAPGLGSGGNHQLCETIATSFKATTDLRARSSQDWDNLVLPELETCIPSPTPASHCVKSVALESRRASPDTGILLDSTDTQISLSSNNASTAISLLSQLIARIASMRCSLNAASATKSGETGAIDASRQRARVLDDTALGCAATWLMRKKQRRSAFFARHETCVSEPRVRSSMLQDIFSASYHFLEVLECVPASCTTSTSETTLRHLDETIVHLGIACHMLLMGVYDTLLAVLEHDALLHNQMAEEANSEGPLGQIRLVSVVQLCAYIVAQQNEAVDNYLVKAQEHGDEGDFGCSRAAVILDERTRSKFACELQKRFQGLERILGFGRYTQSRVP